MPEEFAMPDLARQLEWMTVLESARDLEDRMSLYAPDAVWDMSRDGPGVIEGREAMRAFFDEWLAAYEEYEQQVEEIQHYGNGVVFAVFLQRGRPPDSSGGWIEFRDARVFLWANGLVERVDAFLDIDEARAAAERLAEARGHADSQEDVELVRRALAAAFAQPPDMEVVRELADPDLVMTTNWGADSTEHHGVQGFLDALAETSAAWDPWRQDVERIVDAGHGRVVALLRLNARGRESGVPVAFPWAIVIGVSAGRIATAQVYVDHGEALRVAGVEE